MSVSCKGVLAIAGFLFFPSFCFAEDNPLVDLTQTVDGVFVEMRYATPDNFMKEPLYPAGARCFLRRQTAEKLARVQKKMWDKFPLEGYIANPAKGSNHNRAAAVDVTLVDKNGRELPMPSAYDEFSERAHRDYAGGTPEQTQNRAILEQAMQSGGFHGISTEWWHFDDTDAKNYPVLDFPL